MPPALMDGLLNTNLVLQAVQAYSQVPLDEWLTFTTVVHRVGAALR